RARLRSRVLRLDGGARAARSRRAAPIRCDLGMARPRGGASRRDRGRRRRPVLRARAPRSPLGIALIACAVGVACSRPSAPEPERDEAAKSVPGLETALAEEATVRNEVRAAGAVAADVELPEARDTRALVAEAEARRQ